VEFVANLSMQASKAVWFQATCLIQSRIELAVDIVCTNSIDRYELVEVVQKFFKRIGIVGDSGNFIHLAVGKTKPQEVLWPY